MASLLRFGMRHWAATLSTSWPSVAVQSTAKAKVGCLCTHTHTQIPVTLVIRHPTPNPLGTWGWGWGWGLEKSHHGAALVLVECVCDGVCV
jgi:hypothetical protein